MAITDELREYVKDHTNWDVALTTYPPQRTMTYYEGSMDVIADRIDAEHAKAQRRWMAELDAARDRDGYIKLPKDAGGEVIRIGDMVEWIDGDGSHAMKVTYLQLTSDGWYVGVKNYGLCGASELLRHHKQPTVEDVLREFALACEDAGNAGPEVARIAAEYASRLRLAGEGE